MRIEERIAEGLEEIGGEARVLRRGEGVEIDLEALREPDQERRGERAPVVLDEVQVARRDAEALRELNLGEVLAAPERLHLGAEKRCVSHADPPRARGAQQVQIYQYYNVTSSKCFTATGFTR